MGPRRSLEQEDHLCLLSQSLHSWVSPRPLLALMAKFLPSASLHPKVKGVTLMPNGKIPEADSPRLDSGTGVKEIPLAFLPELIPFSPEHLIMFNPGFGISSPPTSQRGPEKHSWRRVLRGTLREGPSKMSAWMLWALVAFALGAFPCWGHGTELRGASLEEERSPRKGDLGSVRLSRSTQHQKHRPTVYRTGSLSTLSRGLVANVSELKEVGAEENAQRQEREAGKTHGACWGCCNHTGSRQPSKGDSGVLGVTPSPEPPKRNTTKGYHRPGAYTPMGKLHRLHGPEKDGQAGSFPWTKRNGHRPPNATQDRCQGCCGRNSTAVAKPPGRRDEGKGSQTSGGSSIQRPWRPALESDKVPNQWPSQKGEESRWPSFSVDPVEPWRHQRGP